MYFNISIARTNFSNGFFKISVTSTNISIGFFNEGDYSKTAIFIEQELKDDGEAHDKAILQLLSGNCYLNLNQPEEAIVNFKAVINSPDAILSQYGKWYYALTLLKLGKKDESGRPWMN